MSVIHRKGQRESKGSPSLSPDELKTAFARPEGALEAGELRTPEAEVAWSGRNVEIPDHFRAYVGDKLSRLEHFDPAIFRFEVVLYHEPNPRLAKQSQVVEITVRGKGPVVRSQACGENFYAATELAGDKLQKRLRRSKGRKHIRKDGPGKPISLAEASAQAQAEVEDVNGSGAGEQWDDGVAEYQPGQVVRIKDHPAVPMTVDEALYEMELVGHDFFLFHDSETDRPSVVYRRHAYDYGLIRLAQV